MKWNLAPYVVYLKVRQQHHALHKNKLASLRKLAKQQNALAQIHPRGARVPAADHKSADVNDLPPLDSDEDADEEDEQCLLSLAAKSGNPRPRPQKAAQPKASAKSTPTTNGAPRKSRRQENIQKSSKARPPTMPRTKQKPKQPADERTMTRTKQKPKQAGDHDERPFVMHELWDEQGVQQKVYYPAGKKVNKIKLPAVKNRRKPYAWCHQGWIAGPYDSWDDKYFEKYILDENFPAEKVPSKGWPVQIGWNYEPDDVDEENHKWIHLADARYGRVVEGCDQSELS